MTKEHYITYKRHEGAIDFAGNGIDIYYLFFVVHELGRLIYELQYNKTLQPNDLVTLRHLNLNQTVNEIQRMVNHLSTHSSPNIELIALVEVPTNDDPSATIQLIEENGTHTKDELLSDLYLFQLFSHMNLLQGYDFSSSATQSSNDYVLT